MLCKYCNKDLPKNRKSFCDRKCSSLFQNKQVTKNCDVCNTPFLTGNNRKNTSKYCSIKCRSKFMSDRAREIRVCKICSSEFEEYKKRKRDFCSDACRNIYSRSIEKIEKIKLSYKNTILSKYNTDHYFKTIDFRNKSKETKLEKYGNEKYINIQKCKETKKEKYGDENYNNRKKSQIHSFELIKDKLHLMKIKIIDEQTDLRYIKNNEVCDTKFKFKCEVCGNVFHSWLSCGHIPKCNVCYPDKKIGYKVKSEIRQFLSNNTEHEIFTDDRSILNGQELDFYIPKINFAIEYTGIVWHSNIFGGKQNVYHLNKLTECELKNIKLITIFENDWLYKKDIIKSILLNMMGKTQTKIYARQCNIKEISAKETNIFLNINHLQGKCNSSINIGLYSNSELQSVMTFSKSRFNKNYEYEMTRFCNKINTQIVGGASRLLKYFIKNYKPNSIISYSDRRYFTGNFYIGLSFKFIKNTTPNYYYFKTNKTSILLNRINFQKHKLKNKLKTFNSKITEWENMQLNGYDRIWDCGNKQYIWKNKNGE